VGLALMDGWGNGLLAHWARAKLECRSVVLPLLGVVFGMLAGAAGAAGR